MKVSPVRARGGVIFLFGKSDPENANDSKNEVTTPKHLCAETRTIVFNVNDKIDGSPDCGE